ncbi:SDR family NAD(P)-dependent oxidoreductase [Kroppenstedtia eburnea]|uniref:Polysaccharide biosynthesis protein n=1 Tax=Kroppenstedtia eburnea TaxID=714067 RepID=A0A1N7Q8S2_9BACL|nr:SDR family NAD(P)-dependent oxidoreductase [Kroppenstedtia eburnea]EGK12908.1 polysaccharide biosynthesis protein [Desmospora sp. 8437]SIT19206.1 Polysaccharide biosynthesis protein [Kroppenstedtia eburnea]
MSATECNLKEFYSKKNILVTGGTGSIGEKVVESILQYRPNRVIVFNRDDSKQYLMKRKFANADNLHFCLGDIRDYQQVVAITRNVDIVFHTAALKQVPVCEENPFETININVLGSKNLINACKFNHVSKVVNISTDKAVHPSNIMGMTKWFSEKLFKKANAMTHNEGTRFSSVRFGNVIGSRGSVIPVWLKQLQSGQPLTITDTRMTRFLMTPSQAVHLVLKAAYYSLGGETYILKMNSISVNGLLKAMNTYCKRRNMVLPPIRTIGKRPGEKMYEELLYEEERYHLVEDTELYAVLPTHFSLPYLHFQPANITRYRSDYVDYISHEDLVSLIDHVQSCVE